MKELLKWTIIYNKYFPFNNKTLFEEAQELESKGKLKLKRQKDYVLTERDVNNLINDSEDIYDLLTHDMKEKCEEGLTMTELKNSILNKPELVLTSTISVRDYKEGRLIDCGAVEIKNLIEVEKWKEQN